MRGTTLLNARVVKSRCDFVALASRYTRLRHLGSQYIGLCPFHPERHPSFYLQPQRKIWKCFGCGAGGDVFDFIQRAEGCDFRRSVEIAAFGVAAISEGRRPERFEDGVGAKPLKAAKRPHPYSQSSPRSRVPVPAHCEESEVYASIRRLNLASSRRLATACEPLTAEELSLLD